MPSAPGFLRDRRDEHCDALRPGDCTPFFPYGISIGDRIAIADDGTFRILEKRGHPTIRAIVHDAQYAHEQLTDLHDLMLATERPHHRWVRTNVPLEGAIRAIWWRPG